QHAEQRAQVRSLPSSQPNRRGEYHRARDMGQCALPLLQAPRPLHRRTQQRRHRGSDRRPPSLLHQHHRPRPHSHRYRSPPLLPQHEQPSYHRQTHHPLRPPVQNPQETRHGALHVLLRRGRRVLQGLAAVDQKGTAGVCEGGAGDAWVFQ
ncbi:hypothetical protein LTR48_009234, partial [Friedmanniomyces endolithicus]